MRLTVCLILAIAHMGCVTTYTDVGSRAWYDQRIQELDDAYNTGEITKDRYLELKLKTDEIREDYISTYRGSYHHYHYYHPHYPHYW